MEISHAELKAVAAAPHAYARVIEGVAKQQRRQRGFTCGEGAPTL
jgi:hypothetical protein